MNESYPFGTEPEQVEVTYDPDAGELLVESDVDDLDVRVRGDDVSLKWEARA